MKLTEQEIKIINFLKDKETAYFEELAQFSKNPQEVKLSTIQRAVSEIKKKHKDNGVEMPFSTKITQMPVEKVQNLVKVVKTPAGNMVKENNVGNLKFCQIDFKIKENTKQILTKSGIFNLNSEEFAIFKYLHNNAEKVVSLEELRDKVVFHNFGSKLPARWFDSILRKVNNIRRSIPGLSGRLLTIRLPDNQTGYIFK